MARVERAAAAAARAARIVVPGFISSSRRRRGCDARMSLRKRSPSPAKVTLNERGLGAVYWFMPQLIDYARFLLALPLVLLLPPASVPQAAGTRLACAVSYVFSHLLDFVDGRVARAYDQCSHFGILLDHTLDIMTTAFMWAVLVSETPSLLQFVLFVRDRAERIDTLSAYINMVRCWT